MKTSPFTNSKHALAFARSIIVGTVVLVDSNSGDDVLTAAARDDDSGNESYRRLMERKNDSHRRNREERLSNFTADEGFDEDEFPEQELEIGDYSSPSQSGVGEDSGEAHFQPGIDGPGT
jgi:hypothetical protein